MKKLQQCIETNLQRYSESNLQNDNDLLAVEEPLEMRLPFINKNGQEAYQTLAITMRTPGHDEELATGFLYSEGIIDQIADIQLFRYCSERGEAGLNNSLEIKLLKSIPLEQSQLERRFTTYSSCGLCGKTSIHSLELQNPPALSQSKEMVDIELIKKLSQQMAQQQSLFQKTGSVHGSGLFDFNGNLLAIFEDVGRHNALDKLFGHQLKNAPERLKQSMVFVSGRASFEMVQKTVMAGVPILVAAGAPTSLAVHTAKRFDLTLVGFLGKNKFNIYNASWRFNISSK